MKQIRECRMGLPKQFKTGAIVGSYPKPLLYLQFDRGGLDVVPKKAELAKNPFPWDCSYEEVVFLKPGEVGAWLSKPDQPKILAVDYTVNQTLSLTNLMKPSAVTQPLDAFISDYNIVCSHINADKPLPWKTAVLDSVTGYEDVILSYISSANPNAMADARQWAGQCGGKVRQTILTLTTWPCHVAVIMHAMLDKNELTGSINEIPSVFGGSLRTDIGGLFSQFFYATKDQSGKPKIWPTDKMFVRGIGARWPHLTQECDPDFVSIYGKELT